MTVPNDEYYSKEAASAFAEIVYSHPSLLLNVEYKAGTIEAATLTTDDENKRDVGKTLLSDGYALIESRREGRFKSLVSGIFIVGQFFCFSSLSLDWLSPSNPSQKLHHPFSARTIHLR